MPPPVCLAWRRHKKSAWLTLCENKANCDSLTTLSWRFMTVWLMLSMTEIVFLSWRSKSWREGGLVDIEEGNTKSTVVGLPQGISQGSTHAFCVVDGTATVVVSIGDNWGTCDRSTYLCFHTLTHDLGDDIFSSSVEYVDILELGSLTDKTELHWSQTSKRRILSKRFSTRFFHSHPFNEMFIVNGKSQCCNDTLLTSCLQCCKQRILSKNTSYVYAVRISISLAILSEILIQIGYFLSASLYFSKRGAYWDRLCRDVVGRWLLVGCQARALWPNGAS